MRPRTVSQSAGHCAQRRKAALQPRPGPKTQGQLPDAIAEFGRALELDPNLADAHYTLGVTLWQQGNFPQAATQLQAAIAANPGYAEAHYTLGTVYKQENKLPEAAAELHEAIRLQPDFVGAHITLASVLRQQGDTAGAAQESRIAARITKEKTGLQGATFATNSGDRLLKTGDLEAAIAQFRTAIKLAPTYAMAHLRLAQALRQKGEAAEAEQELHTARTLDPALDSAQP